MKKWILNLISILVGLTLAFFLFSSSTLEGFFSNIATLLMNLIPYVTYGMVFFLATAGIASLNLQNLTRNAVLCTLLWGGLSIGLLSLFSGFFAYLMPLVDLDQFISLNRDLTGSVSLQDGAFQSITASLAGNNFKPFFFSFGLLLPIVAAGFYLGWGVTPTKEVLKPAYSVINSFSEVSHKLLHSISHIMNVGLAFFSGIFLAHVLQVSGLSVITSFFIFFSIAAAILIFLVFPVLIVIFTKEHRPYYFLSGLLSPILHAFFSGTTTYALPLLIQHTRTNLGIAKRVNALSIPLLSLAARGGSAFVSSFVLIAMLSSRMGDTTLISTTLQILLACSALSIISYAFPGMEVMFITLGAIHFLDLGIYEESTFLFIILLRPLLQGTAAVIDTLICGLGAAACGYRLHAFIPVERKDRI